MFPCSHDHRAIFVLCSGGRFTKNRKSKIDRTTKLTISARFTKNLTLKLTIKIDVSLRSVLGCRKFNRKYVFM